MPLVRRLCDRDSRILIHDKLLLQENSPIVLFLPGYKELPLILIASHLETSCHSNVAISMYNRTVQFTRVGGTITL